MDQDRGHAPDVAPEVNRHLGDIRILGTGDEDGMAGPAEIAFEMAREQLILIVGPLLLSGKDIVGEELLASGTNALGHRGGTALVDGTPIDPILLCHGGDDWGMGDALLEISTE